MVLFTKTECFDEIAVYTDPVVDTQDYVIASSEGSGCDAQEAALFAPLLPLLVLWRRRRDA